MSNPSAQDQFGLISGNAFTIIGGIRKPTATCHQAPVLWEAISLHPQYLKRGQ